ncbi:hypothetical protein IE982_02235 [Enterobacter hormaechei]|nr:hypothetical protein [Enterobacter hormaechei]
MPAQTAPLSLEGEGWGEGEHTALVVIPFTLCSLLLCHDMAGERAGGGSVATTPATRASGGKSPLRGVFGLFLPAYRGRAEVTSL